MIRLLCVVLLAAGSLAAAPVPKTDAPAPPDDYFPVALGMRWEYETVIKGRAATLVRRITQYEAKDGIESITATELYSVNKRPRTFRWRIEKNEVRLAGIDDLDLKSPIGMARRTLKAGDAWEELATDGSTWVVFEVGPPEAVVVPAGTFTALRVSERERGKQDPRLVKWYAEGVGEIKSEQAGRTTELKSFNRADSDK